MPEAEYHSIAPALFKKSSLISVKFRAWTGTVTLKEADQVIQGVTNADVDFFKKGSVMLVPSKELRAFNNRANKFVTFLKEIGRDFPIPYARLVAREDLEMINQRCRDCHREYAKLRDEFVAKYPQLREERIAAFNEKHPEYRGRLDGYFPSTVVIAGKFDFKWVIYQVQDIDALNQIEMEEQENFRNSMKNYVHELARDMRKKAVDAAVAFKKGMDRAKQVVDGRAVASFREFLERYERLDIVGDQKLRDQIASMKAKVFAIDQWNVEDKVSMDAIKAELDKVVQMGTEEGEMADVARGFIREQTGVEVEFTLPAAEAVSDNEGFGRDVEQAVAPDGGSMDAQELVGDGGMDRNT